MEVRWAAASEARTWDLNPKPYRTLNTKLNGGILQPCKMQKMVGSLLSENPQEGTLKFANPPCHNRDSTP